MLDNMWSWTNSRHGMVKCNACYVDPWDFQRLMLKVANALLMLETSKNGKDVMYGICLSYFFRLHRRLCGLFFLNMTLCGRK